MVQLIRLQGFYIPFFCAHSLPRPAPAPWKQQIKEESSNFPPLCAQFKVPLPPSPLPFFFSLAGRQKGRSQFRVRREGAPAAMKDPQRDFLSLFCPQKGQTKASRPHPLFSSSSWALSEWMSETGRQTSKKCVACIKTGMLPPLFSFLCRGLDLFLF